MLIVDFIEAKHLKVSAFRKLLIHIHTQMKNKTTFKSIADFISNESHYFHFVIAEEMQTAAIVIVCVVCLTAFN